MSEPTTTPCILVVADAERVAELIGALSDPLPTAIVSRVDVVASSGGDDTIDLADARNPHVIVVTASLEAGDASALVKALRGMVPRAEVAIVVVGDLEGPIRTALDAIEMAPDRFVGRPLAPRTLRFAVASALEAVMLVRGPAASPPASGTSPGSDPGLADGEPEEPEVPQLLVPELPVPEREPIGFPFHPRGVTAVVDSDEPRPFPYRPQFVDAAPVDDIDGGPTASTDTDMRAARIARWEALADSIIDDDEEEIDEEDVVDEDEEIERQHAQQALQGQAQQLEEPEPLPPVIIRPRRHTSEPPHTISPAPIHAWQPGTTDEVMEPWSEPEAPTREPTLILRDDHTTLPPGRAGSTGVLAYGGSGAADSRDGSSSAVEAMLDGGITGVVTSRTRTIDPPPVSRTRTGDDRVDMAEREQPGGRWGDPMPLAELVDRDSKRDLDTAASSRDDLAGMPLDDFDDELVIGDDPSPHRRSEPRIEVLDDLPDDAPPAPPEGNDGRDFARQLRAKMSMMAQRLFQGADASASGPVDLAPRHDHHTEIDLASLGEETPLGGGGVTEIEARASQRAVEARELTTSPGSWDTQVRERGLPESGELVRGISDAPMLVAKMFITGATGRVGIRREAPTGNGGPTGGTPSGGDRTAAAGVSGRVIEKVVFFDQGRPVFASSNEPGDRMGELLVREGKITASQYERCQAVVAESGRRMGEILVDVGYLKRRELLPAVRRHVEDIVYSLFGWDRGHYRITLDAQPCAERIRLSRHPAALVLEGIRRKLDRTTLERLIGPPSTVIEVADRERLNSVISTGDLAGEERAALAAFDGQADLLHVARTAAVDLADVLPLAWGLCALGLATARRTDTEVPDESTALVGETDLAIDRERVHARWQLVTEADYFALLGVRRDATTFEIRRAYQSARRDFAVDSFPNDLRRELAQELDDIANVLDEAFRVLRDDRLRTTYLAHLVE